MSTSRRLPVAIIILFFVILSDSHIFFDGPFKESYIALTENAIRHDESLWLDCVDKSDFNRKGLSTLDQQEINEAMDCLFKCNYESHGAFSSVFGKRVYNSSVVRAFYEQNTNASSELIPKVMDIYDKCINDTDYEEISVQEAGRVLTNCTFFRLFNMCANLAWQDGKVNLTEFMAKYNYDTSHQTSTSPDWDL